MVSLKVKRTKIHDVEAGVRAGSLAALEEVVNLLETTTKAYAPVVSGTLRSSIFQKIKGWTGKVVSPVIYAGWAEERSNRGQGYMKPAAQYVKTKVHGIVSKHIRSGIKRS